MFNYFDLVFLLSKKIVSLRCFYKFVLYLWRGHLDTNLFFLIQVDWPHICCLFFLGCSGSRGVKKPMYVTLLSTCCSSAFSIGYKRALTSSTFGFLWFGWVLWHINYFRFFNAKCFLYKYIKYIWFGWVGFYGISTIVGYFIPNAFYTYILNIYDLVGLGFMAYQPL